ncbi:DUF1214 domain-containing protein [Mycolicibacterium rhodesiae]|nr:DUF1214 domain-containing protein [Mycolicibacterium rhodesiae]MCV7348471.1 DUF1214 domain-containing protein [Mycolicibacterium rhodesiae]
MATTVMTGATAVALTVGQAASSMPLVSGSVRLMSSDYSSTTNAIIAAQQQIIASNTAYPFIKATDYSSLPSYTQTLAIYQLFGALNERNDADSYSLNGAYLTYGWDASGTDPSQFPNDPNADNKYILAPLAAGSSYVMTIHPAPGSTDVTFVPMKGSVISGAFSSNGYSYSLQDFTPNPDGSYTITLSSSDPGTGNWVNTTDAVTILYRDTVDDWGQLHDTVDFQKQGSPSRFILPVLSDSQIQTVLTSISENITPFNSSVTNLGLQSVLGSIPANVFTAIKPTTSTVGGPILPGQLSSFGRFDLAPDQALVVKVPTIGAGYTGAQLANAWQLDLPYATAQGSLNSAQVFTADDGYTYYVVSAQNPGVANWLDTSGTVDGTVTLRFQNYDGATTDLPAVTTQVVSVTDVKNYLPAGTPAVSLAEYNAQLKQRQFELSYTHHQFNDPYGWATANLELDQIKAAIGADQFAQIFGSQANVPSVFDRMTNPAMRPDVASLFQSVLADPSRSLAAIVANLPLATQDILNPIALSALRVDLLVAKTALAIQKNLAAGNVPGAVTALGAGIQGIEPIIKQTWIDPATSITAGLLNARDDLSVAIANASNYSPLSIGDVTSAVKGISQVNREEISMVVGGFTSLLRPGTSSAPPSSTSASATAAATARPTSAESHPASAGTARAHRANQARAIAPGASVNAKSKANAKNSPAGAEHRSGSARPR